MVSKASPQIQLVGGIVGFFVNNLFEEECGCIFLCFHLVNTQWV